MESDDVTRTMPSMSNRAIADPGDCGGGGVETRPMAYTKNVQTVEEEAVHGRGSLLDAFYHHLRTTFDRTKATADTYRFRVRSFDRYLQEHHRGVDLVDADATHVKAFLLHVASLGHAPGSRANDAYALRAFGAFLVEEGLARQNLAEGLRVRHRPKVRTEVYTDAEADQILNWVKSQESPRWKVGFVLFATLRYTGLRLSELVELPLDQVDLEARRIRVIGKGEKERVIPIPPVLMPILTQYLTEVRPELSSSRRVFANPSARSGYFGTYCPRIVQELVADAGRESGVPGRHFPHRWRHTYATSLLRRGVDIHMVQRLLGHSNIATTIRYLHLSISDLATAVDMAFPDAG